MSEQTHIPASVTIPTIDQRAIASNASRMVADSVAMIVDSTATYDIANSMLGEVKAAYKALEDKRISLVDPLNQVVKSLNTMFKGPLDACKEAESTLKIKMIAYTNEQRRIEAEARAKAEEAARAEQARLAEEARAHAEEARKQAEEAEIAEKYGDQAAVDQARAKAEQASAEASALATSAAVITAPVVQAFQHAKGVSISGAWKARVTDKAALVSYIAAHPEYLHLVDVPAAGINALAKAMKENIGSIQGLEAEFTETLRRAA